MYVRTNHTQLIKYPPSLRCIGKALDVVQVLILMLTHIIDDIFDELHGSNFFTKLDLHLGDHQFHKKEVDIPKTTFSLMSKNFIPYLHTFILVFFHDILMYSKTWEVHI